MKIAIGPEDKRAFLYFWKYLVPTGCIKFLSSVSTLNLTRSISSDQSKLNHCFLSQSNEEPNQSFFSRSATIKASKRNSNHAGVGAGGEQSKPNEESVPTPYRLVPSSLAILSARFKVEYRKDEIKIELLELLEIGCFEQFTAFGITL